MRRAWDLMPPGATPSRFVAIAIPAIRESRVWSIDDNPALRPAGEAYLADARNQAGGDQDRLGRAIATRLADYASHDDPVPNLVYLEIFALTELHDGRSVVVEIDDRALRIRPMASPGYADALAEYDALGLDADEGPAP